MKRRRIDPSNCTLLELVYAQTGSLRKSAQVTAYISAWAVARRELGRDPSVEEYAEYWRESRRTAFRDQERFRQAFPNLDTPGPIVDVMETAGAGQADRLDLAGVTV